jgi:Outer membrane protein beta-barrel domain
VAHPIKSLTGPTIDFLYFENVMLMKRILSVALLVTLFLGTASAQTKQSSLLIPADTLSVVGMGAKIGLDYNSITGKTSFKDANTVGFSAGGFAYVERKNIGIRVEGLVHYTTYHLRDSFISGGSLNNVSIDIPVLFEYNFLPHAWIQIGPQFSTLVSVTYDRATPDNDPKNFFQTDNFSGVIGLELRLPYKLSLGARYTYGFSNIRASESPEKWNASAIQAYLGLKIW